MRIKLPSSGFGKFIARLLMASRKTRVSCAEPSHPTDIKVKHKSKSHTAITLKVGIPFLPI